MSIRLKSCPRCGGNLFADRDVWGEYLQCSYLRDLSGWRHEERWAVEEAEFISCGHERVEAKEVSVSVE